MIPVCVKWNKQTYEKVEIDTNKPVADFKNTLLSLTNVPIERQKLMAKGGWVGILKDDADWKTCKLTEGMTVLLMGTADVAPEPMQVVAQEESKADNLKADESQILHYPIGMMNTGNTCYLNSVLQSLRFIPEFTDILSAPGIAGNSRLLNILGQVFQVMKSSKNAIPPVPFIQELRNRFPQFAEMRNGHYAQQDADELFSCIATELQNTTSSSPAATGAGNCFSFDVDAAYSCVESNEEPPLHLVETMNKLTCNIQGGTDKIRIDNLYEGLKLSFECQIEKISSVLNRDANWMKKQKLLTLPNCLCIHFVRFFWKAFPEKNSNGQTGTKCKILRPILYPETLDMYEFCSEQLQSQLQLVRSGKADSTPVHDGKYKLYSVVAHKGRDADSGHYVACVRDSAVENRWWRFDDSNVTAIPTEEVLSLKGGGDKEMVYLCIYRAM